MATLQQVEALVGPSWAPHLYDDFHKDYMRGVMASVRSEREQFTVLPKSDDVFRSLRETPLDQVKVVIVGQDPYPTPGYADGLAFSVRDLPLGMEVPKSLQNIFKEMEDDLGITQPPWSPWHDTDLTRWARQGVLLLNTYLTVRAHVPESHSRIGWNIFTSKVLQLVAERYHPTAFIAWGSHALRMIQPYYQDGWHFLHQSPHPSPLSAYRGFFGSKPFSKINAHLESTNQEPIRWYEQGPTTTP